MRNQENSIIEFLSIQLGRIMGVYTNSISWSSPSPYQSTYGLLELKASSYRSTNTTAVFLTCGVFNSGHGTPVNSIYRLQTVKVWWARLLLNVWIVVSIFNCICGHRISLVPCHKAVYYVYGLCHLVRKGRHATYSFVCSRGDEVKYSSESNIWIYVPCIVSDIAALLLSWDTPFTQGQGSKLHLCGLDSILGY